jgi:hypothetical protein
MIDLLRQASFAVDLSLFKMSVVAPSLDLTAQLPNAITHGMVTKFIQNKSLSIQVRSRSNSPSQDDMDMIPHRFPEKEIANLSSKGADTNTRKRRRARA